MGLFDNLSDLAKAAQSKAQEKIKEAADAAQAAKEARQERAVQNKEHVGKSPQSTGAHGMKARLDMDDAETQAAFELAQREMVEPLPSPIEKLLRDIVCTGETVIYKVRSSSDGDQCQLVLTSQSLIFFRKGVVEGGIVGRNGVQAEMLPLKTITGYRVEPRDDSGKGHFKVFKGSDSTPLSQESTFWFESHLAYFKSILMYRKLRELQQSSSSP